MINRIQSFIIRLHRLSRESYNLEYSYDNKNNDRIKKESVGESKVVPGIQNSTFRQKPPVIPKICRYEGLSRSCNKPSIIQNIEEPLNAKHKNDFKCA